MTKKVELLGKEYAMTDYGVVQFDEKEIVGTIQVPQTFTANDINSVICTGLEGGIGYWAILDTNHEGFENAKRKENDVTLSDWATMLLLQGKTVRFFDNEDDSEVWELTLEKLLNGIKLNAEKRPHDSNIENGDVITSDCIIQYALFGEIQFG